MIIGNPKIFAIESRIAEAYPSPSLLGLGCFVVYLMGHRYGVYKDDATLLACSFDEVGRRIAHRGAHTASFAREPDAGIIADAIRLAIYAPAQENEQFFGIALPEFQEIIYSCEIEWAPDGDAAFDDGSVILHFDLNDQVRLVGFRSEEAGYRADRNTLRDLWLPADQFYQILKQWRDAFEAELASMAKVTAERQCHEP